MEEISSFEPSVTILVPQPLELELPDLSLDAILGRLPDLAGAEAVGLTGSVIRGWGNTFSDVDVYVFADDDIDLPMDETAEASSGREGALTWTRWIGIYDDWRVDLKVFPTDALTNVLAPYCGPKEPEFGVMQLATADFVYRATIARPLVNGEYFARMRELLDGSSYRRARARSLKGLAENALLDVFGQLRAGDDLSARMAANASAAGVADACLVLAGDICPSPKWLVRRLRDTPEAGITPEEYVRDVLDGPREGESHAACALRVARWTRSHFLRVEEQTLSLS